MTEGQQPNSTVAVLVGVYLILLAAASLCINAILVGCGGVLGGLTVGLADWVGQSNAPEAGVGVVALGAVSGLITVLGIIGLALSVATFVVAAGVFIVKPWAYIGAIVVNGAFIVLQVLTTIVSGGALGPVNIVLIVLSILAIVGLLVDEDTKRAFGRV
ncbi:MAG: hypothetical protein Kow00120_26980 [Anaerolineae bacterium]